MISYKATEFKIMDIYYLNDNIIVHDTNKDLIILKIYKNNFKKIKNEKNDFFQQNTKSKNIKINIDCLVLKNEIKKYY